MPAPLERLVALWFFPALAAAGCGAPATPEAPPAMAPFPVEVRRLGRERPQAPASGAAPVTTVSPAAGGDGPVFEACNRFVRGEGFLNVYATHSYPGRTLVELSAVRAIGRIRPPTEGFPETPPGFESVTPVRVYVRDGEVAVYCGELHKSAGDLPADAGRIWPPRGGVALEGVTFVPPAWK